MLTCQPSPTDQSAWDSALCRFPGISLLQSWAYGAAKAADGGWSVERLEFRDGERLAGLAQVVVKRLPLGLGGLAWVNRGPLWNDPADAAPILESLRRRYAGRGFYLRLAPSGTDPVITAGFADTGRPGWASARMDLTPPLEQVRKSLDGKWRNRLVKAEREALTIEEGPSAFAAFITGYVRFLAEKAIPTTVTPDLLERLQTESGLMALVARHDGKVVGGALVTRYGAIGEYLAGFGTDTGRRLGCGHLLLWRAVEQCRREGLTAFDLGGLDPLRTPTGIKEFKGGMKGVPYRLANELECCPLHPLAWLVRWKVARALAASDGGTP
ncbi:conserved hypothetical protein [Candidatus Terasakiella magnetica]|nr:conserved hypothetical protein [Candidatus Terasakiella magnetica]